MKTETIQAVPVEVVSSSVVDVSLLEGVAKKDYDTIVSMGRDVMEAASSTSGKMIALATYMRSNQVPVKVRYAALTQVGMSKQLAYRYIKLSRLPDNKWKALLAGETSANLALAAPREMKPRNHKDPVDRFMGGVEKMLGALIRFSADKKEFKEDFEDLGYRVVITKLPHKKEQPKVGAKKGKK